MKENTFDVPAYKFFVLKIADGIREHNYNHYHSFTSTGTHYSPVTFIPFENVDGLEVDELRRLIGTNEVFILGATYCELNSTMGPISKFGNTIEIYFGKDFLDHKKNMTIDAICAEAMEEKYVTRNDREKRMYRCFFERYQDKSYKKTKERIRKIEMRK